MRDSKITEKHIGNLQPKQKAYKVTIAPNFYVVVYPSGSKTFRMRAFKDFKETTMRIGNHPDMTLDDAIDRYEVFCSPEKLEAHFKLAESLTFYDCALNFMKEQPVSPDYAEDRLARFKNHIFPHLGRLKMHEISNKLVKTVTLDIQSTGKIVLGQRCLTLIKQVFEYASTEDVNSRLNFEAIGKILKKSRAKNFAAATTVSSLKKIIASIRKLNATEVIKLNIECGMHWFMRPSELVSLKWSDIDFEEKFINFMPCKNGDPNVVPLNNYTLGLLRRLLALSNGSEYIFSSPVYPGEPVSSESASSALRRLKVDQTMHGFRATARTLIVEKLKLSPEHVEKQLSHQTSNPNGTAYDRTKFLEERMEMMRIWSEYLVQLQSEI